jgi:maltose alpha-D-glucosyltransferase/alpha-amylase
MRNLRRKVLDQLRHCLPDLPEAVQVDARKVLDREDEVLNRFRSITTQKVNAMRIRHHGDFHLGQVLYTGKDFVIIDFEGEPTRSIGDRRVKRSPLRDVVGMVRSFHYAAYAYLLSHGVGQDQPGGMIRPEDLAVLEPWARFWYVWASAAFVKSYLETAKNSNFVPASMDELRVLFEAFLLEKALYELGYELNHRPDWVRIPLWGILELLDANRDSKLSVEPNALDSEKAGVT